MNYMGSKARFANEILPIILSERRPNQYYVEPFCGGCNTLYKVTGKRIGADLNKYLIAMWKFLTETDFPFPRTITKEQYVFYRQLWHTRNCLDLDIEDAMTGWVGFMASFNGRFFEGGYSGHKVRVNSKSGFRNYISEQIRNTVTQVDKLKGVDFYWADYSELEIPSQSIIYCDPPYKGTTGYNVSKHFDHNRFYEWCRKQKEKGHTLFVSEYSMPDDFTLVWEKESNININCSNTKKAVERLYKL